MPERLAPRCEHLDGLQSVMPSRMTAGTAGTAADRQAPLALCLTCGWVACSDESPSQHARAHYEETDHPLAAAGAGTRWRWCYVHQRLV